MTTKKLIKPAAFALAMLTLISTASAAQRVKTYSEAQEKAGSDGIVVFCYGPDWNRRSVRMLNEFWKTTAAEQACGNAAMVAVPYYQDPAADKKNEAETIGAGAPNPPGGICPAVIMLDKDGNKYAALKGTDDLGDFSGGLGISNMRNKLAAFRKRTELLAKAETLSGQEKAKVLMEISDLPIDLPGNLLAMAQEADPSDKTGIVRRLKHDSKAFLYEMMETKDGFLTGDFIEDYKKIQVETQKIIDDSAYYTIDRQRAMALQIGSARRQGITGNKITNLTKAMAKIAENTPYGKLANNLGQKWSVTQKKTAVEKALDRDKKKEEQKKESDKKKLERKVEKTIQID